MADLQREVAELWAELDKTFSPQRAKEIKASLLDLAKTILESCLSGHIEISKWLGRLAGKINEENIKFAKELLETVKKKM